MAELNNSLLQFDSGILDVNENLSNTENTLLSYSNESLSPDRENVKHEDAMKNKSFTVLSNNFTNMPDNFSGFVSNNVEDLSHNSNAFDSNAKSDSSSNFAQDNMKLIDFNCADLNFSNECGGMISDFSTEENCADAKDEEFHDAVQFFKDPTALTFLENAGSANAPSDPLITRSSLYVNFDPLHAKFYPQSSKDNDLGGIAECEVEPEICTTAGDPEISVGNSEFKIPFEKMLDVFPENVPEVLANNVVPDIQAENKIPEVGPEITVPKVLAETIVPELQPENVVPKTSFEYTVPELQPENEVPELQPENEVNKTPPGNIVPEVLAENIIPDVLGENVMPDVQSENKMPEVLTDNIVPEIEAENIVLKMTAHTINIPDEAVEITVCQTLADDVPEMLAKDIDPEVDIDECKFVNKHLPSASPNPRASFGNILLSFDSPVVDKNVDNQIKQISDPPKFYTEEELQQALKIKELSMQESFLKRQHDLELERTEKQNEMEIKFNEQNLICSTLQKILKEFYEIILAQSEKELALKELLDEEKKENAKLKQDLKTSVEDLQSVENTFSDFHKRYEQCKSMLKDYSQIEGNLKLQVEDLKVQLNEKDEMYKALQSRTQEMLDKANVEVSNAKRAGDAQTAVLKAQLKKAEMKISSLENDVKHVKVENEKLSSICDELMTKVSES